MNAPCNRLRTALVAGAAVLLAGCGSTATATPTATAGATPSGTTTPPATSPSATAGGAVLTVSEFGFALPLTAGIEDATYRVDRTGAGQQGLVAGVFLSTRSLNASCPGLDQSGAAYLGVYTTEPTGGPPGGLPSKHVGQYWLNFQASNGERCSAAETTAIDLFSQAFNSVRPA